MLTNRLFYVFATLARSFDSYHVKNKIPHLIFSTFTSLEDKLSNLYENKSLDRTLVLKFVRDPQQKEKRDY